MLLSSNNLIQGSNQLGKWALLGGALLGQTLLASHGCQVAAHDWSWTSCAHLASLALVAASLACGDDLHASQTDGAAWGHDVANHLPLATAGHHDLHASQTQQAAWACLAALAGVGAALTGRHDLHASQTDGAAWGHDVAHHLAWATAGQHDLHASQTDWAELGTGTTLGALVLANLADLLLQLSHNHWGGCWLKGAGNKLAALGAQLVVHHTWLHHVEGLHLSGGQCVTEDILLTDVTGKGHL